LKAKLFSEIVKLNKSDADIDKFNPYHDSLGRFTTSGGGASFSGTLLHGSPHKGIKEFDMSRAGHNTSSGEKLLFFTDSKQMADDFSYERKEGSSKFFQQRGKKGRVYEVDVEMKNPLDLRKLSDKDVSNILKLDPDGILTKETVQQYAKSNHQLLKAGLNLTADSLKELGYDGLIANTGKAGHNSMEYAVVDSKQAKIRKSDDMSLTFSEVLKFNQNHDKLGRFASGNCGAAASGGISPEFRATLYQAESDSIWESNEVSTVYDSKGNKLFHKQGTEHNVEFSDDEITKLKGATLTHNHPNNSFFSEEDLSVATEYELKEIRACTEQAIYSFKPAGMTNNLMFNNRYKKFNESLTQELKDEFLKKIDNHEMTSDDAQKEYIKELANRRSQFFKEQQKFFKYEYEEIKWDSFEDLW
jgi:hypothetical protein